MRSHHERFADLHSGFVANTEQFSRCVRRKRDRLFTQHMLPTLGSTDRPWHVHVIWQRDVNRLDLVIVEKLFVRSVRARNTERLSRGAGFLQVTRRDGDNFSKFTFLDRWN